KKRTLPGKILFSHSFNSDQSAHGLKYPQRVPWHFSLPPQNWSVPLLPIELLLGAGADYTEALPDKFLCTNRDNIELPDTPTERKRQDYPGYKDSADIP